MAIMRVACSRIACAAFVSALAVTPALAEVKLPVPAVDQSAVAKRGFFYVGGHYVGEPGKEIMEGQIYVEVLAPRQQRRPYPLVLIHGAAQTATNWMGTPDGRKGWAEYFVEQGYVVYMIDQPMRGRSAAHPGDGPTRMFTAENEEWQFTAVEKEMRWPHAKLHSNCVCYFSM
jgi:pimeloyl-ACP methyl ester carboxylesterase